MISEQARAINQRVSREWSQRGCLEYHNHTASTGSYAAAVMNAVKPLNVRPQETALDIGCGTGVGAVLLLKNEPRKVYATDPSAGMLEVAKQVTRNSRKVSLLQLPVEHLDEVIPSGSVNKALAFCSFEYWDDPLKGLQALHRVMVSQGVFHLALYHPPKGLTLDDILRKTGMVADHLGKEFSPEEVEDLFRTANFSCNILSSIDDIFNGEVIGRKIIYRAVKTIL